jgi:hypothetical protein
VCQRKNQYNSQLTTVHVVRLAMVQSVIYY